MSVKRQAVQRQAVKRLALKGPVAKLAPRRRTPLERIIGAIEYAALVRAATRKTESGGRRVPRRPVLIAVAGGVLVVGVTAAAVAHRRKRDSAPPPAFEAPASVTGRPNGDLPGQAAVADPSAASVAATGTLGETAGTAPPGADPEGESKLDVDAPNEGAAGDHPSGEER